jgi:death-on-curing protein
VTEFVCLDTTDLLRIAARMLGMAEAPVRDLGALAAAAARPRTTVFGAEAYPTLATKAAALLHSIARNRPLVDGNKRLAWTATKVFCAMNGYWLRTTDVAAAESFVVGVARGDLDVDGAAEVIALHLAAVKP